MFPMFTRLAGATRSLATKAIITITPKAENELRKLAKDSSQLLRVSVKKKGCSGLSYSLEYTEIKKPYDEEIFQNDVKILIDSKAIMPLLGTEMDFEEDELSSKFVFKNPNVKETCGCGQSFLV